MLKEEGISLYIYLSTAKCTQLVEHASSCCVASTMYLPPMRARVTYIGKSLVASFTSLPSLASRSGLTVWPAYWFDPGYATRGRSDLLVPSI